MKLQRPGMVRNKRLCFKLAGKGRELAALFPGKIFGAAEFFPEGGGICDCATYLTKPG